MTESFKDAVLKQNGDWLYRKVYRARKKNPNVWILVFFVAIAKFFWMVATFRLMRGLIGCASSMVSIAGDIKRRKLESHPWRAFYLLSGSSAVFCAYVFYLLCFGNLKRRHPNELDVLGNILSKAGGWEVASKIGTFLIEAYWYEHPTEVSLETYALTCKWMSHCPEGLSEGREWYLGEIRTILELHPELPPEVTVRLYEELGDIEKMEEARSRLPG